VDFCDNRSNRAIRPGCAWTILVNILAFHIFLQGVKELDQLGVFSLGDLSYFAYRSYFRGLLRPTLRRHKSGLRANSLNDCAQHGPRRERLDSELNWSMYEPG